MMNRIPARVLFQQSKRSLIVSVRPDLLAMSRRIFGWSLLCLTRIHLKLPMPQPEAYMEHDEPSSSIDDTNNATI